MRLHAKGEKTSTENMGSELGTERELWQAKSLMYRAQQVREMRVRAAKIVALLGGMLFVLSVPAVIASMGLEFFADAGLLPSRLQELCGYRGTLLL